MANLYRNKFSKGDPVTFLYRQPGDVRRWTALHDAYAEAGKPALAQALAHLIKHGSVDSGRSSRSEHGFFNRTSDWAGKYIHEPDPTLDLNPWRYRGVGLNFLGLKAWLTPHMARTIPPSDIHELLMGNYEIYKSRAKRFFETQKPDSYVLHFPGYSGEWGGSLYSKHLGKTWVSPEQAHQLIHEADAFDLDQSVQRATALGVTGHEQKPVLNYLS